MPSLREKMEAMTSSELFDALANPGDRVFQWASAELKRRRLVTQETMEKAQIAATNAQKEAAEYAKQSLTAMRKTAFWTAMTALATFVSSLGAWFHR